MPSCDEMLRLGVTRTDRSGRDILYRRLLTTDDPDAITAMLHDAYAPLAAAGMRFVASYQDVDTTRRRMAKGETIVAVLEGGIVGIVTLADAVATRGTRFLERPDVAAFGQLAVRPSNQCHGIGSTLIALVEERAREQGIVELALDTSEHAAQLIAFYQARGYRFIEHCQWSSTNYRSMVFAKRLAPV